ncbi:unnamed protein product [Zymoseptoria tritici ST99CH_3D7]|uniref:Nudix hydrolase domain-containing protein n=1 Tax=Zymoseptoria tritici (strain ST99CH_3D7) TaxID=1276538 RepID=A0A1X7S0B1_ZYMT9|nr:unnamed protein product [Zymoseptoria tritici ST99CH_3D7]
MAARTEMSSYLSLVEASNTCTEEALRDDHLYRLYLPFDDQAHGLLLPSVVAMIPWTYAFKISHDVKRVEVLDSSNGKETSAVVNRAFAEIINICLEADMFSILRGKTGSEDWRAMIGTKYPVKMYRYAQPLFGYVGQGVHLTAYTRKDGAMKLWIPRRGATVDSDPNMLDNTAAGSVPAGMSILDAMVDEADEEASLPRELVRSKAQPAGVVSYISPLGRGDGDEPNMIIPDVIYVYDIELPEGLIPKPRHEYDWEVKEFYLMDIEEVNCRLFNQEFKPNCALVLIDFFVRHGIITPSNDHEYALLNLRLRRHLPLNMTLSS